MAILSITNNSVNNPNANESLYLDKDSGTYKPSKPEEMSNKLYYINNGDTINNKQR